MVPIGLYAGNTSPMTRALFLCTLFFASTAAAEQRLELLIVGPSDNYYTLYGHAAVAVIDDERPLEEARVFNFGMTNFKRPDYIRDFLTGRVKFWGKATTWAKALGRWKRNDRTVWRYPLALDAGQASRMVARMERDIQPERREYVYDTFRENCATRLRDYLDEYTGGAVYAALGEAQAERSYRDDVRHAYSEQPALLLMTEIVPGVDLDTPRTDWELSYRPEHMAEALQKVTLEDGRPLLGAPVVENRREGPDPRSGSPHRGQVFLGVVAAVVFLLAVFVARLGPRFRGVVLALAAGLSSLVGVVLVVVGLGSDWPDMQRNWLVLGFVPFDLLLLWTASRQIIFERDEARSARLYVYIRVAIIGVLVVLTPFVSALRGPLPPRLLALAVTILFLRCLGAARARSAA